MKTRLPVATFALAWFGIFAGPLSGQTTITYTANRTAAIDTSAPNDPTTLTVNSSVFTQSGVISGSGGVIKNGAGTLILTANNTYTGTTTISAGTLQIGASGATGSLASSNIVNNGTLDIERSGTLSYSGGISGSGALIIHGGGTVTLSGDNSYTGTTSLISGNLSLGSSGALGPSSTISFTGGTLQFSANNTTDYSARFSTAASQSFRFDTNGQSVTFASPLTSAGGSLNKIGTGTLTLTGDNAYTGATTLTAGTLALGSSGALGGGGTIAFNGGTLQFSANNTTDYSARFVASGVYNIDTNGQSVTFATALSGSFGSLNKSGTGTLTLSAPASVPNVTVSAGTLRLAGAGGLGSTASVNVSSGATLDLNDLSTTIGGIQNYGNINLGSGTLTLASNTISGYFPGTISGTGGLAKTGTAQFILGGNNTFSGGTTISAGTLQLTYGAAPLGTGSVSVASGATLDLSYYSADLSRVSGAGTITSSATSGFYGTLTETATANRTLDLGLSGALSFVKSGSSTLTLNGNYTYSGATTISGGTLAFGSDSSLSNSAVAVTNNATLDLAGHNLTVAGIGGNGVIAAGNITAGTLASTGEIFLKSGTFDNTFTGTGLNARTWLGGDANATITLNGTNNRVFTQDANQVIIGHPLTGAAGTVKLGSPNALAASNQNVEIWSGALDLNGQAAVRGNRITLQSGSSSALLNSSTSSPASFANSVMLSSGQNLIGGAGDLTLSGPISGSGGIEKVGAGTLLFSSASTNYPGATTISGGTLQFGSGGSIATFVSTNSITNNGNLVFNHDNAVSVFAPISGTGTLTKSGTGTLMLAGFNNTYTGATTVSGGTLRIGYNNNGSVYSFPSSGITNNAAVEFVHSDSYTPFAYPGVISGSGTLTKSGDGSLILTANNTYAGTTTISGGTLQLGNGGATGSVAGSIVDNGNLTFKRSDPISLSSGVTGSGSLTQAGTGLLTFPTNQVYTGATIVASGSALQLGTGGTTGGVAGDLVNNGTVTINRSDNFTFSNALSGTGTLIKTGANTLTLSSDGGFGGTVTINGGTVVLASPLLLTYCSVNLASGTTLDLANASANVGTLSGAGNLLLGTGTLTTTSGADTTFSGVISGTGGLIKEGGTILNLAGSNTYTGGTTLNGGVIALGSSGALGPSGTISLNGGLLQFSAGNTVDYSPRFSTADNQSYFIDTNGQSVTFASALVSAGGSLNKVGAGTLTLSGANTYTGGTQVNGGTLRLTRDNILSSQNSIIIRGGTLDLAGTSQSVAMFGAIGYGVIGDILNGTITATAGESALQSGTFTARFAGTGDNARLWIGGDPNALVTLNGTNDMVYTPYHSQLIIGHPGVGAVDTVKVGNPNALLAATETAQVFYGRLDLNGVSAVRGNSIQLFSGAASSLVNDNTTAAASFAGTITIDSGASNLGGAGNLSLNGVISGDAVNKVGAGTLTLSGINTYTGGTTLSDGTLIVASGASLAGSTAPLTINAGTLTLNNAAQTVGSLSGTGGTINFGSGHTFTIAQAANTSYAGALTGNGSLVKSGGGELQITSVATYSGGTTISGGTLKAGINNALPAYSPLTLSGGTLGTGGFNLTLGTLAVSTNSTIDFGSGASSLTFANSSAGAWTGTLSILNYTDGTDTLRFGTSSSGLTATQLSQISFGGLFAQIDANGFVSPVSAIPEPSTYGALLGATALGLAWRRRKARRSTTS